MVVGVVLERGYQLQVFKLVIRTVTIFVVYVGTRRNRTMDTLPDGAPPVSMGASADKQLELASTRQDFPLCPIRHNLS